MITALLLVLSAVCIVAPRRAFAVDGHEPLGFRTGPESIGPYNSLFDDHQAQDGNIAYCLELGGAAPSEVGASAYTPYTNGWSWETRAPNAIVWNGYPNTTRIDGKNWSATNARAVTQIAVWMSLGAISSDGVGVNGEVFSGGGGRDEIVEAAWALSQGAKSGSLTAPRYAKRYYGVERGDVTAQELLWTPVNVKVTFTKTSANAKVTDGNDTYAYAGASYDIYRASDNTKVASITTNASGTASCSLKPTVAYYAIETKAPAGFKLNTKRIPFVATTDMNVQATDEPGTFTLTVSKRDSATNGMAQPGASLEGAAFEVTSLSTTGFKKTARTDHTGTAVFSGLPAGKIRVVETEPPPGYRLDPTAHVYAVEADKVSSGSFNLIPEQDFREDVIAVDLRIAKFKGDSGQEGSGLEEGIEGVAFDIVSNSTGAAVGRVITDAAGYASTDELWFGEGARPDSVRGALPYDRNGYTVREVPGTVPAGYERAEDWTIEPDQLVDGATLTYIVRNSVQESRLQIVKIDVETGDAIALAGFTFQVIDARGKTVEQETWYPTHTTIDRFTTDESGSVVLPQPLAAGTYRIREIEAAAPYAVSDREPEFTVGGDSKEHVPLITVAFKDMIAKGQASIRKSCAADGKALEGAEFDVVVQEDIIGHDGAVWEVAGEVVDQVVTDENGRAQTRPLDLGSGTARYAFVETKPPTGHVLDETPIPFELTYRDDKTPIVHTAVEATDEPTRVTVHKVEAGSDRPVAGAEFCLRYEDIRPAAAGWNAAAAEAAGVDAADAVASPPADECEGRRVTTDEDGLIVLEHLDAGAWHLQEMAAPKGYLIDTTVHTFIVDEEGRIEGNGTFELRLENDWTKVDVSKRDITDEHEIPGAHLSVRDASGTIVDAWVSTERPHRIDRLEPGAYTLAETRAPRTYAKEQSVDFTVEENGKVQHVSLYNEPIVIEGAIDKRQEIADPTAADTVENGDGRNRAPVTVSPEGVFAYRIDARSTSSTWVDELTIEDRLHGVADGFADLLDVVTPVTAGDYDGLMNIWYRTTAEISDDDAPAQANATLDDGHKNPWLADETVRDVLGDDGRALDYGGWRLWRQDVPTNEATTLSARDLPLEDGERIVALRFEYGRVEAGFTSREDDWGRDDLKDGHDDVYGNDGEREGGLSAAVIRLAVTDRYVEGCSLDNEANIYLYRNGGGDGLESLDHDQVTQTPASTAKQLAQTGAVSAVSLFALLGLGTAALRRRAGIR